MFSKADAYLISAWVLVVCFVIFFSFYFYNAKINECTSDPLNYTIKYVKENLEVEMVNGLLTVRNAEGASQTVAFGDSSQETNLTLILSNISLKNFK